MKDKHGKDIDTSKLDANLVAVLEGIVGGINHQTVATVTASVKSQMGELNENQTKLMEQVAQLVEAKPVGETDPKNDNKTPDGEANAATTQLMEMLTKLSEKVDGVVEGNKAKEEAASAFDRTTKYINEKFPNLQGKETIIKGIASQNPKDDEEVQQLLDNKRAEMESIIGKEPTEKAFSASVESEGGKAADDDAAEAQKQEKLESIKESIESQRK